MTLPIAVNSLADRQEMGAALVAVIKVRIFAGLQLTLPLADGQARRGYVEDDGGAQSLPVTFAVELIGVDKGFMPQRCDAQT
ncbi:hypothetical protein C7I87_20825 [Mesorhizobium sp. SARCC-RB16n]|nr:hypothetical protein C7I87_20825 [Mesorhizobium sp. SARCC-RB16n]